ncbi:hypothetical protein P3G55_09820 [Leptospira sp. 96542]|nr:hypothetical protein [Leptospira sp. 96542]
MLQLKICASFLVLFFIWNGCTTIGFHEPKIRNQMDFGQSKTFQVCTIFEPGISKEEISELFAYWNEELSLYQLTAVSVNPTQMERPGFMGTSIIEYLNTLPLTKECDRILYLKGRTFGDMVFEGFMLGLFSVTGIKLEIHGAVETRTQTRGYIKAKYSSTIQLLFTSPKSTLVHEGYHLLGCGHQLFMEECYIRIQETKRLADDPETDPSFFPNVTADGRKIKKKQ